MPVFTGAQNQCGALIINLFPGTRRYLHANHKAVKVPGKNKIAATAKHQYFVPVILRPRQSAA